MIVVVAVGRWESLAVGGISKRREKPVFGFPRSGFSTAFCPPIRVAFFPALQFGTLPPVGEPLDSFQLLINHSRESKRVQPFLQSFDLRHAVGVGSRASQYALPRSLRRIIVRTAFFAAHLLNFQKTQTLHHAMHKRYDVIFSQHILHIGWEMISLIGVVR